MTTASISLKVQRGRFLHHLLANLAGAVPAALHDWLMPPAGSLTAVEKAAREAQEVREMAYAYSKTDPGFASDLYAAAARHEGLRGN